MFKDRDVDRYRTCTLHDERDVTDEACTRNRDGLSRKSFLSSGFSSMPDSPHLHFPFCAQRTETEPRPSACVSVSHALTHTFKRTHTLTRTRTRSRRRKEIKHTCVRMVHYSSEHAGGAYVAILHLLHEQLELHGTSMYTFRPPFVTFTTMNV